MNNWQKGINAIGTVITVVLTMITGLYLIGAIVKAFASDWKMVLGMIGCASMFGWAAKGNIWAKKKMVNVFRTK